MSDKYPGGFITDGAPAGYSVAFDGTGDYLSIADNAALQLTGDFTIEFWIYVTNLSATQRVLVKGNASANDYSMDLNTSGAFLFNSSTTLSTSTSTIKVSTWNHIALTRSGSGSNNCTWWFNGVSSNTFTTTQSFNNTNALWFGQNQSTGLNLNGYLSNIRIVKGTAVYTTAFTPPTQLFPVTNTSLLTAQSPTIIDNSTNAFTVTANGNAAVSNFTPFAGYTATPPNPNTQSNTSGIWTIDQADYWMAQNLWPMPYPRQSLRFNSADSAYLNRTPASAGNRKTWTWSGWVKRSALGVYGYVFDTSPASSQEASLRFNDNNTLQFYQYNATTIYDRTTTQVFRDTSAWYHIVLAFDTTQATASNRIKLYVNGVQVTAFSSSTDPSLNFDGFINNTTAHAIGRSQNSSSNYLNGYMADVYFVDGQALTPSSFGQTDADTGAWIPQNYTGSYGTNGFRLTFQDNTGTTATTLGKDWSGNGNNWTPNNFSVAAGSGNDSFVDSPWNFGTDYGKGGEVRGNYCTLTPLTGTSKGTFSNGNLDFTSNATNWATVLGTIPISSGKWYWEVTPQNSLQQMHGILAADTDMSQFSGGISWVGRYTNGYSYDNLTGTKYNNNVSVAYGATYTTNDVIGVAVNLDAGTLTFYKNGISQGVAYTGLSGSFLPAFSVTTNLGANSAVTNFGQRPFAYPISGFKALCSTNLPKPAIGASASTLASKNMNIALYTGNGSTLAVTGLGFAPDLAWVKSRSTAGKSHVWQDSVRGNYSLFSDNASAEIAGYIASLNSDGFTVSVSPNDTANTNGTTYVGWAWKGGGTAVSNTAGSISSSVSANPTAGFSIITYTGTGANATVGHGLGVAPKMVILKSRSAVKDWVVGNSNYTSWAYIQKLNDTIAQTSVTDIFNSTAPTSSVFSLGGNLTSNTSGATYVAYCFAEVAGFSKFGSYVGNGSADGPFVYCGFRPRFVMIKNASNVANWTIVDTSRNIYNVADARLFPSTSGAESTSVANVDILSNGFKVRISGATDTGANTNGDTYIFAVFAETPFNYSRAR